jgi:hypothetical protein
MKQTIYLLEEKDLLISVVLRVIFCVGLVFGDGDGVYDDRACCLENIKREDGCEVRGKSPL